MECAVNPTAGREGTLVLTPVLKPRKIVVVGGGTAGMEVSRIAAVREHRVTLFDQGEELGGQMLLAKIPPHKQYLGDFIQFQSGQLAKAGVEVRLGTKVDAKTLLALNPEVVVVTTGSEAAILDVPGVNLDNVFTARDVLAGKGEVGNRVVIIGGGQVGLQTAEFLASQGKKATVVEMLERLAHDMGGGSRRVLLTRLRQMGITMETKTRVDRIIPNGVVVSSDDQQRTIEADTMVLATGIVPNRKLADELKDKVPEVYLAGDCSQGRNVTDAVRDGYQLGQKI